MSGLLPRTPTGGQTGSFDNLNVQTLTVSISGFINALTANEMSVGNLDVAAITTGTINGDPNLNIVATTASVGGDTIVTRTATQTLTDKTIDSGVNTITVTSAPLSGQDINNVLNQAVRTSSAVTFGTVTTQSVLVSTAVNDAVTVRSSTGQNNQILFQSDAVTNQTGVGYDVLNSLHRVWGYLNSPMVFATNNLERLRIPSGGIAVDNTITNILGLSGTTLAYKNNVVDTSTVQTLTNKTLTSPIISTISNTGTITIPTATTTLVGTNTTDTLTNKTLTSPIISTISNTGTLTLPTSTDTLVGRATTDSLTNKTLDTATCRFSDSLTRVFEFNPSGTSSTTLELRRALTTNRIQSFPDADGDIILDSATQSLTNKDFTNGTSSFTGKVTTIRDTKTTVAATTVTFATIPIATLTTYMIETNLVAYCTAGPNADQSSAQRFLSRAQQVGGAITGGVVVNNFSNQFATGLAHTASGTDILVQATGIASDTINWAAVVTVYVL